MTDPYDALQPMASSPEEDIYLEDDASLANSPPQPPSPHNIDIPPLDLDSHFRSVGDEELALGTSSSSKEEETESLLCMAASHPLPKEEPYYDPQSSPEEEKQSEDEELAASARTSTSRVTSYSRATRITRTRVTLTPIHSNTDDISTSTEEPIPNFVPDVSTTEAATDEESQKDNKTDEEESQNDKQAETSPSKSVDTKGEQQSQEEEESIIDWEEIKQQRARDRRFGCLVFNAGFVGVVIALILLGVHIASVNNDNNKNATNDDAILAILDLPPSTLKAIEQDPSSPQGRAFSWMQQDPWWDTYTYSSERARQRMGLATLYYATNGAEWNVEDNFFLSYDQHECDWLPTPIECNVRYQLTSLGLRNLNLVGTVPPELWLLAPETLERVVLAQNELRGTIGTEIGVLRNVVHLDLSQNEFSGSLPKDIGRCQQLQTLILSSLPLLQGTIPPELMSLRRLQGLWWRDTAVRGSIPSELGGIPSLQIIDLSGNLLRGSLPEELFTDTSLSTATGRSGQATGLQQIRVSHNRLIGSIPEARGRILDTLETLDVTSNNLESTVLPTHLARFTKLSSLQVGGNSWTGAIPSELGLLKDRLESLGLQETQFVGTVPIQILELAQLQALYLHNNPGLEGTLVSDGDDISTIENPLPLAKLTNLKELTINNTPLRGVLPVELCAISILSFTCNPQQLCGCDCECLPEEEDIVFPSPTAGPTELAIISTSTPTSRPSNSTSSSTGSPTDQVISSMAPSIGPTYTPTSSPSAPPEVPYTTRPLVASSLVSDTTASPTMSLDSMRSAFVGNLPNYTQTGLRSNPTDGPQALALEWLLADSDVVSYSQFRRTQRFAMATMYYSLYGADVTSAETAWLAYETHECFWSAIDSPYVTCQTVIVDGVQERVVGGIFLDKTGLAGSLPPEVALFSSLVSLQGSNSNMVGSLPTTLGLLSNLETLRLPHNKLEGPLPTELGQCASLKRIHLGSNQRLNGSLPSELGLLTELEGFVISHNSFEGPLPDNLPGSLATVDLSGNDFTGTLPVTTWSQNKDLQANLQRLRVSESGLRGPLAPEIGQITQLSELTISQSQFTGALPSELGLCTNLRSLDASLNKFTGAIPATLGQVTLMQNLHLHSNDFQGTIPTQLASMTSLEVLTLHNNEDLSGRIPDSLSSLSSLEVFTVNETAVAGRIPSQLCGMDDFSYTCSAWLCGCRNCECEQTL